MELLFYQKNICNNWVLIGQYEPVKIQIKTHKNNTNTIKPKFINAMDKKIKLKNKIKID